MPFTKPHDKQIMQFEKEIAYFYGAENPESIAHYYLEAIQRLEKLGMDAEKNILAHTMLPLLKEAYAQVQKQTSLHFDLDTAAQIELELILAQAKEEPFEHIYHLMLKLYATVFRVPEKNFYKSAMLRTFLYKYKISVLKADSCLSEEDLTLMLSMAKISKEELNKFLVVN